MDLIEIAIEEIALEGLEGCTISDLWRLYEEREPEVDCAIDKWTKPYIWKGICTSPYIDFYLVDFQQKQPDIPKKRDRHAKKMPDHWINDHNNDRIGYSTTYFYRNQINEQLKGDEEPKLSLDAAEKRWGQSLYMVATQELRQRILFGKNNPPILEDMIPPRYIILELIGKSRNRGFIQSDFQALYKMDSRTSFHHVKVLVKHRLITKQNFLVRTNTNRLNQTPLPPKASRILHLSSFANFVNNQLSTMQKYAARICDILSDQPIEIARLKYLCRDIPQYKRIRQWLFGNGYIQYIVNGKKWCVTNHKEVGALFYNKRPCYVSLLRKYVVADLDDDNDEFLDYIENCNAIEPQLVYEESLHNQGYRVIVACREHGITMKKLAEVLCIPYAMARSMIRYYDTNKLGRLVNVDHLKLKYQKIVAIQFLHQSETVQEMQSNKIKMEEHRTVNLDIKPNIDGINQTISSRTEQNLALAENLNFTGVADKNNVSLRKMARINHILDSLKVTPVFDGSVDLYKSLLYVEESQKSLGKCCRKTFKKIIQSLVDEGQIKAITVAIDETTKPAVTKTFYCSANITEASKEFIDVLEISKLKHLNLEKRREYTNSSKLKKEPQTDDVKRTSKGLSQMKTQNLQTTKSVVVNEDLTDTDDNDDELKKSESQKATFYATYGRFQRLNMLHLYLWRLVYGSNSEIEEFAAASQHPDTFIDLVQSRHIWLRDVDGLPKYVEGRGWFNLGDILLLMPLELLYRVIGIKIPSKTTKKYLEDNKRKLIRLMDLPPKLKRKLVTGFRGTRNVDVCVELLVLLAQMGVVAVAPDKYPCIRSEIMLFLRKEALIVDTRFSEKSYCQTQLPKHLEKFPENIYHFSNLSDIEKYWNDLKFVCLNTPLGVTISRNRKLNNDGENSASKKTTPRAYRSYTVLRDFQDYYKDKDFSNMEPVILGNGLGAGGFDSTCFGHLSKNWYYERNTKKKNYDNYRKKLNKSGESPKWEKDGLSPIPVPNQKISGKKITVKSNLIKTNTGGRALKRKLSVGMSEMLKSSKARRFEHRKNVDHFMAKRVESVREKIRIQEIKRKAMRKGKKELQSQTHDDRDREALQLMKGTRVRFSEKEDAYVLLLEIVQSTMKLTDKGQPLEKEHPKILWQAIRNIIHDELPESRDKTWNAIHRRSRNIKKNPICLIIYRTCVAELEQNQDFINLLNCTTENWKDKLKETFLFVKEIYSKHFNRNTDIENFPQTIEELNNAFDLDSAYREVEDESLSYVVNSEQDIRVIMLQDLIQNALTAQKFSSYIPSVAFKIFDTYPRDDLKTAYGFYQKHKLLTRVSVDIPRSRSIPIQSKMYSLSAGYYRHFEPDIPLRIYLTARSFYMQVRDGKTHANIWKEKELNDLLPTNNPGTLHVDFDQLQGGHVAYILYALVNDRMNVNFQVPDEVTLNDENHLQKLRDGKPKFQQIAFEQRLRKAQMIAMKNKAAAERKREHELVEEDHLPQNEQKSCDLQISNENIELAKTCEKTNDVIEPFTVTNKNEPKKSSLKRKLDSLSNDDDKDSSSSNTKKSNVNINKNLKEQNQANNSSEQLECSEKLNKITSNCSDTNPLETINPKKSLKLKKNVKFTTGHGKQTRYPEIFKSISDKKQMFTCSFRMFNDENQINNKTFKNHKIYNSFQFIQKSNRVTDSQNSTSKTVGRGSLHYSKTSLNMHRTLLNNNLTPTNAMNSHDTLIINPLSIQLNLCYSPFRMFFDKMHKTDDVIINRFRKSEIETVSWDTRFLLSSKEYDEILKDHMNFSDDVINDHDIIIKMVALRGGFGLPLVQFQETFVKKLCSKVMNDWEFHVQTLLNFRMLYKVGCKDAVLVTPQNTSIWTYKAPRILNISEVSTGKPTTHNSSKHRTDNHDDIHKDDVSKATVANTEKSHVDDVEVSKENVVSETSLSEVIDNPNDAVDDSTVVNQGDGTVVNQRDGTVVKEGDGTVAKERDTTVVSEGNKTTKRNTGKMKKGKKSANDNKDSVYYKFDFRTVPVKPWLKLDGEMNGALLRRYQEAILVYIMTNPGTLEEDIIKYFLQVLKPTSTKSILEFLQINGAITKHYQLIRNVTLFGWSLATNASPGQTHKVYYVPSKCGLLNMVDINR